MQGAERSILRAISRLEEAGGEAISRKVALSVGYVEEVCNSLVERGYLLLTSSGRYQLTSKGEKYNPSRYIVTPRRASRFRD